MHVTGQQSHTHTRFFDEDTETNTASHCVGRWYWKYWRMWRILHPPLDRNRPSSTRMIQQPPFLARCMYLPSCPPVSPCGEKSTRMVENTSCVLSFDACNGRNPSIIMPGAKIEIRKKYHALTCSNKTKRSEGCFLKNNGLPCPRNSVMFGNALLILE